MKGFYSTFRTDNETPSEDLCREIEQGNAYASPAAALKSERDCHISQLKDGEQADHEGTVEIWELRCVASYRLSVSSKLKVEKLS